MTDPEHFLLLSSHLGSGISIYFFMGIRKEYAPLGVSARDERNLGGWRMSRIDRGMKEGGRD